MHGPKWVASREGSYSHICQESTQGVEGDIAIHWKPPVTLSQAAEQGIIAVSVITGLAILAALWRFCCWPRIRRWRAAPQDAEGVDLEDMSRPPPYRRTGKPGEVPPKYSHESIGTASESASINAPEPVYSNTYGHGISERGATSLPIATLPVYHYTPGARDTGVTASRPVSPVGSVTSSFYTHNLADGDIERPVSPI
jgi:hypothetical protein